MRAFSCGESRRRREPGASARRARPVRVQPAARGGARARGRGLGGGAVHELRSHPHRRAAGVGEARERESAEAAHPRPLRRAHRRGRVPSRVAQPDAALARARPPLALVDGGPRGGARRTRCAVHARRPGRGRAWLSRLDDTRGGPGSAGRGAAARSRMGAAPDVDRLRRGRALRDGDDRAAGRIGRPREHDRSTAGRRRRVSARRREVVLLGADVRRLPRARPGARRPLVLPDASRRGVPDPAAQGQARRPLERLERDRARRRPDSARRRGGPRRPGDHRDGRPHAARLRPRDGGRDAAGGRAGYTPRRAPVGVRGAARRSAADAERARRSLPRVGSRNGDGDAARARI